MKYSLLFSTLLSLNYSHSQEIELELQNPAPRVGEDIEVLLKLKHPSTEDENSEDYYFMNNNLVEGTLSINQKAEESGELSFGPISFSLNGKKYTSNSLTVMVDDALPETNKGIWIRQVNYNGKSLLIIEQRIPNEWKKKGKNEMSFDNEGLEFLELKQESLHQDDLRFNFTFSTSTSQQIKQDGGSEGEMVSYQMMIYEIEKADTYSGEFQLEESHFLHFPKGVKLEPFIIK